MNKHIKLPIVSYLAAVISGDGWIFGWVFGGFTSFFLYIFNPLNLLPFSFSSIFFFVPAIAPVLLVCVGLLFIYKSVNEGIKAISILKNSEIANGILVMLHFYGERKNEEKIWWAEYHFTTDRGERYVCIGKIGKLAIEVFDNGRQLIISEGLKDINKDSLKNDIEYTDQIPQKEFEKLLTDNIQIYPYKNHFEKPESFKELIQKIKEYFSIRTGYQLMPDEKTTAYPEGILPENMYLFYKPQSAAESIPLISIPGKFTMDSTGTLQAGKLFVPGLIIPILIICIHIIINKFIMF